MPLAWPSAVPTAPLLNEPLIRCSPLADPVARPERVQSGVEDEHGIARGEVAHCTRHSLRMNTILAARGVGLLVQHLVPGLAVGRDEIEEFSVALRLD